MKMKSLKKIIFVLIFVVVVVGAAFLIMKFSSNISDKNIEKLKTSDIEYLGMDENDNYIYMGNDSKVYSFSKYTDMQSFSYDSVNARKDGLEGVVSKNNKVLVEFGKYYDILDDRFCGSYIVQNEEGKYGLLSYKGNVILDTVYDNIETFGSDVPVMKVTSGDKYYIATTSKAIIYETSNSNVTIEFGTRLNKNSDKGLVKIVDGDTQMVYDIQTGKEVYSGEGLTVEYNIIKDSVNNVFVLVDENGNIVKKVDYIAEEESLSMKFDEYIAIETNSGYYEIYDKKFNKVLETERQPAFFKTYKDEIYIINNVEDAVEIYKDGKQVKKIDGYEYSSESMTDYSYMFGLVNIESQKTDLFNFKFEKVKEDVTLDKVYPKYALIVNSDSNKVAYTIYGEEIVLGNNIAIHTLNTESTFNDYILVSKSNNGVYDLLDLKGNSVIKNIANIELVLNDHVVITDNAKGDMYLFDIKNNKEIFRFEKDKYTSAYKTVPALKLTTGYFDYKGQQIAKIEE